tara:strand:- start:150 stop:605 length:456 start_codon:yes stop_codon:yes gene_type:complete
MIAVIKTGGKQYTVKTGQILKVEKIEGKKGDTVSLDNVLAITDKTNYQIGTPKINGVTVKAKILDQIRDKKIIVFKKRRRQNYRSTQGHRQYLTVLKIENINDGNKKNDTIKKTVKSTEVKKTAKPKNVEKKKSPIKKTTKKKTSTNKEKK